MLSSRSLSIKHSKSLSSLVVLVLCLSLLGINSTWTQNVTTEQQDLDTGYGKLVITGGNLKTTATSSVNNLVPGDKVERYLTLENQASYNFKAISLSVTDDVVPNELTSSNEGLKLTVERCDVGYTNCTSVLYGPDGDNTNGIVLSDIQGPALTKGGIDYLKFTQKFVGPDNEKLLKAKRAELTYAFQAMQRDGNTVFPSLKNAQLTTHSNSQTYIPSDGDPQKVVSSSATPFRASALDPATGDIYFSTDDNIAKYTAASNKVTVLFSKDLASPLPTTAPSPLSSTKLSTRAAHRTQLTYSPENSTLIIITVNPDNTQQGYAVNTLDDTVQLLPIAYPIASTSPLYTGEFPAVSIQGSRIVYAPLNMPGNVGYRLRMYDIGTHQDSCLLNCGYTPLTTLSGDGGPATTAGTSQIRNFKVTNTGVIVRNC